MRLTQSKALPLMTGFYNEQCRAKNNQVALSTETGVDVVAGLSVD